MPIVVVVDQDAPHVDLIVEALREHGVEARVTGDGAEVPQLVRSAGPDAVVLSVDLKGVSGYSVCNRLKKDPALARVPLLLTSAEASEETFAQHSRLKTRAEGYLRKPFDKKAVWRAVSELWQPPQGAAEAAASPPADSVAMEPIDVTWEAAPAAGAAAAAKPSSGGEDEAVGGAEPTVASVRAPTPDEATALAFGGGMLGAAPPLPPAPMGNLAVDRTQPEGAGVAASPGPMTEATVIAPEVTIVRATDPDVLAMSRRPGPAASGAPAEGDLAGPSAGADDLGARLARLEAQHGEAEARLRAEVTEARGEVARLRGELAAERAQRQRVAHALDDALRAARGADGA